MNYIYRILLCRELCVCVCMCVCMYVCVCECVCVCVCVYIRPVARGGSLGSDEPPLRITKQ